MKKVVLLGLVGFVLASFVACGTVNAGKNPTESSQQTEETESEFYIEIADATEILTKTWNAYTEEERFDIMGGHFGSANLEAPAKFDLTQVTDLVQMYCVPVGQIACVDDAATMIDFYNSGRFTAGAYHINDIEAVQGFIDEMKTQVLENQWHGEIPEKLLIIQVDEQYVVTVYGRENLVDEFKSKIESIYQTMIIIRIEEKTYGTF